MTSPRRHPNLWPCLVLALVALASSALFWSAGPCDDEFIVYRYAANWAAGLGPCFNPGERVEGFTCPAWVALFALVHVLDLEPMVVTRLLGALALVVASVVAARHVTRLGGRASGWITGLALATSPVLAYHGALGLGTLATGAALAVAYAAARRAEERARSSPVAALALGLAALIRPEALVLLPGFVWAAPRARRWRFGALALALPFAWQIARLAYYADWLPHTFALKKLGFVDDLAYGSEYLLGATLCSGVGLLLVLALAARPAGNWFAARSECAALLGAGAYLAAVVGVGGDYMELARFAVPVLPLLWMLVGEVLVARAALLLTGALALALLWPWARRAELHELHAFDERRWIAIGQALGPNVVPEPPHTGFAIATAPVGAIGYFSQRRIVDLLGVTQRGLERVEPDLAITMKGHHRYDAEHVLRQRPEVVILGNGVLPGGERRLVVSAWERTLFQHPDFQRDYAARTLEIPGSYVLLYFQRRDSTPLRGSQPATTR